MENKTTQPQPQVQKALAQLDATIDKLTELVKIQEERLASILKEQPQKVENTCELQEREVPLAETLNSYNRRLNDIIDTMVSILSRIEL